MSVRTVDPMYLRYTDASWARPLPASVGAARSILPAIVSDILAIPEAALGRAWDWIGGSEEEVRYGLYRVHEILERAEMDAARTIRASAADRGPAADLIAPSGAARWDLHGLLAPLSDADLDADPGGDEWTIRRTLGHTVISQQAYGWFTGWWQDQAFPLDQPALPGSVPDEFLNDLPDEDGPGMEGSVDQVRARLDGALDQSVERLAGLPEDRLGFGARWSGFAVPISFRLGRWSSHIREHTVQVEKTLALLGRVPTGPERLVRLALAAYGRAEAVVLGQPDADDAAEIIRAGVAEARETIADARRAAGA